MPPALAALLFALGFAAWIYSKTYRSTGGNTQTTVIVSGISGIFAFVIFILILSALDRAL